MIKYFLTVFISLFLLAEAAHALDKKSPECSQCHQEISSGLHKNLKCSDCHAKTDEHFAKAADFSTGAKGCIGCHENYSGIMSSHMVTRESEKKYVHKIFNGIDNSFYDKNCRNCHVTSCMDCHKSEQPHSIQKPTTDTCQDCHRDYYIGIEYSGHGQRDDHERYTRGVEHKGGYYASMLPDVHFEKGMQCADCHSMKSLSDGAKSSKTCTDCHKPDKRIIEHSISAHMEKMECYTCHSAWANQEYGTFWIKLENTKFDEYFRWVKRPHIDYAKSSHTKEYTNFPIGINAKGKYSPIRPEFITFLTYIKDDKLVGAENRLVSNYFKAVFPHTVRRGTQTCESCHASGRKFMREKATEKYFNLNKDGLVTDSFYNARWFRMHEGRFVNDGEFEAISEKSDKYKRLVVLRWQKVLELLK
jgi:hypothetical protein